MFVGELWSFGDSFRDIHNSLMVFWPVTYFQFEVIDEIGFRTSELFPLFTDVCLDRQISPSICYVALFPLIKLDLI